MCAFWHVLYRQMESLLDIDFELCESAQYTGFDLHFKLSQFPKQPAKPHSAKDDNDAKQYPTGRKKHVTRL